MVKIKFGHVMAVYTDSHVKNLSLKHFNYLEICNKKEKRDIKQSCIFYFIYINKNIKKKL